MTCEFAKRVDGSGRHIPISARLNASNTNLRVPAAGPVDEQNGLVGVSIEIANNFSDYNVNQPLLGACVRGRCIPSPAADHAQVAVARSGRSWDFRRCGAQLLDPPLKLGNPLQCAIPAPRVHGQRDASPDPQARIVVRQETLRNLRLQAPVRTVAMISSTLNLVGRQYRCFNSPIGDSLKDLQRDRTIDPHSGDADT